MQFETFILLLYKEKIQSIKIIITKLHKNVQEKRLQQFDKISNYFGGL